MGSTGSQQRIEHQHNEQLSRMKLILAVLAALCACTMGDGTYKDCCTLEDRQEVQHLWNMVWEGKSSTRRNTIAMGTLMSITKKHPEIVEFVKSHGITSKDDPDAKALSHRMFTDLDVAINLLDDPAVLKEYLRLLLTMQTRRAGDRAPAILDMFTEGLVQILNKVGGCHNLDAVRRCLNTINAMVDAVDPLQNPPTTTSAPPPAPAS